MYAVLCVCVCVCAHVSKRSQLGNITYHQDHPAVQHTQQARQATGSAGGRQR